MSAPRIGLVRLHAPAPVGTVLIARTAGCVVALDFDAPEQRMLPLLRARFGPGVALEDAEDEGVATAVHAYLDGALHALDALALDPGGTPFQQRAWAALRAIPPGETRSYAELAASAGCPGAARAAGAANARNPISLAVPCHRVVGTDGRLTGYGGGIERKRWLLAHERRHAALDGRDGSEALRREA